MNEIDQLRKMAELEGYWVEQAMDGLWTLCSPGAKWHNYETEAEAWNSAPCDYLESRDAAVRVLELQPAEEINQVEAWLSEKVQNWCICMYTAPQLCEADVHNAMLVLKIMGRDSSGVAEGCAQQD